MDNPIMILDEPTSALDMESEYHIKAALANIKDGKTVIVIAHRLSTIQSADEIVVLDSGQITERGNHEDLLREKGLYSGLFQLTASI